MILAGSFAVVIASGTLLLSLPFAHGGEPVSFIKRVVGLPGDLVEMRGGTLVVNGMPVREAYLPQSFHDGDNYPPTEVRKGYYFVLGDHRRSSNDSRTWGEVPEKYIYGRAVFRFWPFDRVGPIR